MMRQTIRVKLIRNSLVIIISTIFTLDLLMIIFFRQYYYNNRQQVLTDQIESSLNFYNKYFSKQTLIENIYDNVDDFWNSNESQVEILDKDGKLLMDSLGIRNDEILKTNDISSAVNGQIGRWIGKVTYSNSSVMALSHPIIVGGEIIGIMRVISSLDDIENDIESFTIILISISLAVVVVGIIVSLIMAREMVQPIIGLTSVAKKMANGDLKVRGNVVGNDEIAQLSDTLNYMAEEVDKRETLKNQFISSVSHELRTPLTAIKGWVITLNNDETDKEMLKLGFDIIEKETDRLSDMVEELLDFSKLVGGITSLQYTNVDMKKFVQHIYDYMKPRAIDEERDFKVFIDDNLKLGYFDLNKMKQVLINLIDNAFKFTDTKGSIKLEVIHDKENIKFIVTDDGAGISKEDLPRVKEKFYKGKNSRSKNGIGLSICDEIVKLHKGQFIIESELNKGTKITILIPSVGA